MESWELEGSNPSPVKEKLKRSMVVLNLLYIVLLNVNILFVQLE